MPRRRVDEDYDVVDVDDGVQRKRSRSCDYAAAEEDDDVIHGGGRGKRSRQDALGFLDIEVAVDSDEEEEDENEGEDDFIDLGADIPDEADRRIHHHPLLPYEDDEQEDVEEFERRVHERYAGSHNVECNKEATDVEQQALLPSVRDPKLWMVKCAIGHEKELAVCLMQKCIDRGSQLQIRSAVALNHLKNYIYIEAEKEAHIKEAIKGMRNVLTSKIILVPNKEMTDVLSVQSREVDISRETWFRLKIGTYKGDLAKDGREAPKNNALAPPARLLSICEARELNLRVERKRDQATGDYYEKIEGMMFKDGFLLKFVSLKSLSAQNVHVIFDELEKFRQVGESGDGDMSGFSTLFSNRKRGHFMKGNRVIVVKGDLRNSKGWVEKVEECVVHIKTNEKKGLPKTLAIRDKELSKYFEPGDHVKVVSGATEGATGTVISVEGHVVHLVSDRTKELIRAFADNVVESSEVTSGLTRIGDYELHDLVLLNDNSFAVIISVDNEAFQGLKGVLGRPDVAIVRLRDIRYKIEKKKSATDQSNHVLSVKDVVRILDGPCKGKQGPIKYIYNGVLFIYDRHQLENADFICVKSESCKMVGGPRASSELDGNCLTSRFAHMRTVPRVPLSPIRSPRGGYSGHINFGGKGGGRGHDDALTGVTVKNCLGDYKGCRGRVKGVKGSRVLIELDTQVNFVEDFIVPGAGIFDEDDRKIPPHLLPRKDARDDIEETERKILSGSDQGEATDIEKTCIEKALLPSVGDPKLWVVKCVVHALYHPKDYIYSGE